MKLSGCTDQEISGAFSEVVLSATEAELREIAMFLIHCASEMGRLGASYDHVHLSDVNKVFANSPHLIVVRA